MALPSTGAMSFSAIRSEYGKSGAFSMGDCAGLNGQLPSSAIAQVSASTFRSARRGPDNITINRATWVFLVNFSGYTSAAYGSASSRSFNEGSNRLLELFCGNSKTYFKLSNYTGHWRVYYNGVNKGAGTYNAGDARYEFGSQFWGSTNTGTSGTIQYRYNN